LRRRRVGVPHEQVTIHTDAVSRFEHDVAPGHSASRSLIQVRRNPGFENAIERSFEGAIERPFDNTVVRSCDASGHGDQANTPTFLYFEHTLPGKRSLRFEGLFCRAYALFLVDSRASHSFASKHFCADNSIRYAGHNNQAVLPNGAIVPMIGLLANVRCTLGPFRFASSFYVLDMPNLDVVLGMDFLDAFNPKIHWRKCRMKLKVSQDNKATQVIKLPAFDDSPLVPHIQSKFLEICSLEVFSNEVHKHRDVPALVGYVRPAVEHAVASDDPVLSGKGADDPAISSILSSFRDLLVSKIPGRLPPQWFAADGTPIEHTIETSPNTIPYSRPPRPFSRE
jgi:hypothetical protein